MAEKRMIKKSVVDSDMFLDMPVTAQNLYFHLNIRADDDGFIDNPKKVQRMIGSCDDDMKLLIAKQFLLIFDSGVLVIKHWRLHNTLRKDRYSPTIYKNEFALLGLSDSNEYVFSDVLNTIGTEWQPTGNQLETEWQPTGNVDKIREDKRRIEKNREEKISLDLLQCNNDVTKCNTEKEIEKKIEKRDRINYQQIADMYNEICISFPKLTLLNDSRKKAIKARFNNFSADSFKGMFEKAENSDFLKGKNDRNWMATFDWMVKDSNMSKILEGNYDNKDKNQVEKVSKFKVPDWATKTYKDYM